jgi:hypothetical protein
MVLKIPYRLLLGLKLAGLGFPRAKYSRRVYLDNRSCVVMLLRTTTISSKVCLSLCPYVGFILLVKRAEYTAAVEAIKYMEVATNTVIRDSNYNRLNQPEEHNTSFKHQLKEADKISKKDSLVAFVARAPLGENHSRQSMTLRP